jgi:N-acyl-D-aspartate/D-glutamate deacylase
MFDLIIRNGTIVDGSGSPGMPGFIDIHSHADIAFIRRR